MKIQSSHKTAILQALLVTVIWSSSWVLIKFGLKGMPPLTFAGLRYFIGFLCLIPFIQKSDLTKIKKLNKRHWLELFFLGLIMYFLTQGAQFISLKYFPSMLLALALNLTPVVVAVLSALFLREIPTRGQFFGVLICMIGASIYIAPKVDGELLKTTLILIPIVCVMANASASLLGRYVNRQEHLAPKVTTIISMGIGSVFLLGTGVATETFPDFTATQIALVIWLAVIHTAFAFTLWNHTLRTLSSVESSVINNTMTIQIAVLMWVFLDEKLTALEIIGLSIAGVGALVVQLKKRA